MMRNHTDITRVLTITLTFALLGGMAHRASGDDFFWNNPGEGDFADPINWNDGTAGIPGAEDVAIVAVYAMPKLDFAADQTTDRLIIRNGKVRLRAVDMPVLYTLLNPTGISESIIIGEGDRDLTDTYIQGMTMHGIFATVGKYFNSNASLTVDGEDSSLVCDQLLRIGDEGVGEMVIYDLATVSSGSGVIGGALLSKGEVAVLGGEWICDGALVIGKHGEGKLGIGDDWYPELAWESTVSCGDAIIAQLEDSSGRVLVSYSDAAWNIDGTLDVGMNGYGRLDIGDGLGVTNHTFATIGTYPHFEYGSPGEGIGEVILGHYDAAWWVQGDLYVGFMSQGSLEVNSGLVTVDENIYVGYAGDSNGTLTAGGAGDVIVGGDLSIGEGGSAYAAVSYSGSFDIAQDLRLGAFGSLTFSEGGTIMVSGHMLDAGGNQFVLELGAGDDYPTPAIDVLGAVDDLNCTVVLVDDYYYEYVPEVGDAFAVAHAEGGLGEFTFDLPELPSQLRWSVVKTTTDVWLTVNGSADLNGDGVVDVVDLLALLGAWGECPPMGDCPEDLDGNGVVDVLDLLALLAQWTY